MSLTWHEGENREGKLARVGHGFQQRGVNTTSNSVGERPGGKRLRYHDGFFQLRVGRQERSSVTSNRGRI